MPQRLGLADPVATDEADGGRQQGLRDRHPDRPGRGAGHVRRPAVPDPPRAGTPAEIADLFTQAAEANPTLPSLRASLIEMYCELGRHDEAMAFFLQDVATDFSEFPLDLGVAHRHGPLRRQRGRAPTRRRRAHPLRPSRPLRPTWSRQTPPPWPGRSPDPWAGWPRSSAATTTPKRTFRLALELHTRLQAPYWTARTELDWANLLLARARPGDKQAAGDRIEAARLIAESHHYGGLTESGPRAAGPLGAQVGVEWFRRGGPVGSDS